MKIAYSSEGIHPSKAQREAGAKSGTRKNETFVLVGRVEKTPSMSVAAYVSHWRGTTSIEICECERLLYDWNRAGTVIFVDITLIDQFIRLLEQARERARHLASQVAVRRQKPTKRAVREPESQLN